MEFDFEEVEGFRFETDKDGKIISATPIRFKTSISLLHQVFLSREQSILNWEDDKLKEAIEGFPDLRPSYDITKTTYSPIFNYSMKTGKSIISLFFSVSSIYNNNKYVGTVFEKYGFSYQKRLRRWYKKRFSYFVKLNIEGMKNVEVKDANNIQFNSAWSFTVLNSLQLTLRNTFIKLEIGVEKGKKSNILKPEQNLIAEVFIKYNFDDKIGIFANARANIDKEFFDINRNFERYGSINFKGGFTFDATDDTSFILSLAYEKNKRYGFKLQELGFMINYKWDNV